jgi:hypothetical protein
MRFSKELTFIGLFSVFMIALSFFPIHPRVTGAALATGAIGSGLLAIGILVLVIDWILR